ncbi:MAG: penicillin-binding protein 1B, partial [Bdellovibrionales bacterium]|nr:penicillin-binding protein 1B [Bdellovibrionales bacterium]
LISVDVASGEIIALVGGRSFKRTQYNRAIDGHRQVGSIMKPFVYLTALESRTPEGDSYNPLTPIEDSNFTHKYEGQSWSPVNYEKEFMGTIPLMTGLKNSINAATARLGLDIGLEAVIDVAKRAGIKSEIKPLPSLTLGSFELFPMEVAESYTTLARMGSHVSLSMLRRVEDLAGKVIYAVEPQVEQAFARENVAVLIGMMKQTVLAGTARSLAYRGFHFPAAGKTGTTTDSKDAWFGGFTPDVLTVVWLGYDDNTSHGLTGASGAVPIWADYMNKVAPRWPKRDFDWPEGTVVFPYSVEEYNSLLAKPEDLPITEFELVFREGEQPGL